MKLQIVSFLNANGNEFMGKTKEISRQEKKIFTFNQVRAKSETESFIKRIMGEFFTSICILNHNINLSNHIKQHHGDPLV